MTIDPTAPDARGDHRRQEHLTMDHLHRSIPPLAEPDRPVDGLTLGDYLTVLRRRSLTVLVVALLVTAAALGYTRGLPVTYEATARLLVRPLTSDPLAALGPASRLVDIHTERQLVMSAPIAASVAETVDAPSGAALLEDLTVTASEESQTLAITYAAPSAREAARVANGFARAYLQERETDALEAVSTSRSGLEERLVGLNEELAAVNAEVAAAVAALDEDDDPAASPELASARSRQAVLESQVALVANELATATTTSIRAGEIIGLAVPPNRPAGVGAARTLALAAAAGLLLGAVAAFARDRLDDRVRDRREVESLAGSPIVGEVPVGRRFGIGPRRDTERGLRFLAATLSAGGAGDGLGRIVLSAPTDTAAVARTATGLAELAAQRGPTLIVDADPVAGDLTRSHGLDTRPGLREAIGRPGQALELVTASPDHPDLGVLTAGRGTGEVAAADVADVLDAVAERYGTIVVVAPPVLSSAEGMAMSRLGRALLVARLGRTRGRDLVEARTRLGRFGRFADGVVLLGAFRLPRRPRRQPLGGPVAAPSVARARGLVNAALGTR